jgi:hypothetical protein
VADPERRAISIFHSATNWRNGVECLDTVRGLFLACVHDDSHFMVEQNQVNDEVELPANSVWG